MIRCRRLRFEVADGQQLAGAHLNARPAPAQRFKTVSNAENRGLLELLLQNSLKQHLGLLIQSRSGLVQGKQSGLLEQHARQADLRASQRKLLAAWRMHRSSSSCGAADER
jgi:hypothetical protein